MDNSSPEGSLKEDLAALRQQLATLRVDLSGKDWLTVDEAAHYCGVSRSQFDARASEYNLQPRQFMGKKLYEKSVLYAAISSATGWDGMVVQPGRASTMGLSPTALATLNRIRNPTKRKRST